MSSVLTTVNGSDHISINTCLCSINRSADGAGGRDILATGNLT